MTRRRRRPGQRSTANDLFRRVCELTMLAHNRECPTRAGLATRWNMSRRNVSYIIDHAEKMYGVRIVVPEDKQQGYVLESAGVLNIDVLERWKP